jgi:hypothetical protein
MLISLFPMRPMRPVGLRRTSIVSYAMSRPKTMARPRPISKVVIKPTMDDNNSVNVLFAFITAVSMLVMSNNALATPDDVKIDESDIVEDVIEIGYDNNHIVNAIINIVHEIENVITLYEENKLDQTALDNIDVQIKMLREMI